VEVPAEVKRDRRKYHSPLRADQARRTRQRILEAAFALFAERGYSGTTIAAVAERAGVSHETVYGTVGGKRRLLEDVIELAIAGDEDGAAAHEDELWVEIDELRDPADRLSRMVDYSCGILGRTRPIHTVIRGAADQETFATELSSRLLHERLAVQTERIRRHLGEDLRAGLSPAEAGERYCALASPDLYFTLTAELGWTAEQHRRWLGDLLARELLA
jgi:AcrR family transcriptional regulator